MPIDGEAVNPSIFAFAKMDFILRSRISSRSDFIRACSDFIYTLFFLLTKQKNKNVHPQNNMITVGATAKPSILPFLRQRKWEI